MGSGNRGARRPLSDFIKPPFCRGQSFKILDEPTTKVRFLMSLFRRDITIDYHLARRIRYFLKQYKLTNAEIHAILFNLGFRYATKRKGGPIYNCENVKINGYLDRGRPIKTERLFEATP